MVVAEVDCDEYSSETLGCVSLEVLGRVVHVFGEGVVPIVEFQ